MAYAKNISMKALSPVIAVCLAPLGSALANQEEMAGPELASPKFIVADAPQQMHYDGYWFEKDKANNSFSFDAVAGNATVAEVSGFAANENGIKELVITAKADGQNMTLEMRQKGLELTVHLDGELFAVAQAVQSQQDGTLAFGAMTFNEEVEFDLEVLKVVAPALGDTGLLAQTGPMVDAVLGQVNTTVVGKVTPVACTTQECNDLFPGQGPLEGIRNCSCQCCIDEGTCFAYFDTWYGGDIGCSGNIGWVTRIAIAACLGLCVPIGPFS